MDDDRRGGIDVTAYAETVAYLRAASPSQSGKVLARVGLTRAQWEAASGAWTRALEDEIARGEHRLLLAYAAAIRSVRRRLAKEPDAIEQIAAASPHAPEAPAVVWTPPSAPVGAAALAATAPVDLHAVLAKVMPFAAGLSAASVPTAPGASPPRVPTGTLMDLQGQPGASPPVGARTQVLGAPEAATRGSAVSALPALTFEQYVALCAEMAVFPSRVDEILMRARVPLFQLAVLHATWRERMAADAALAERWNPLYAHYRAWFSKPP